MRSRKKKKYAAKSSLINNVRICATLLIVLLVAIWLPHVQTASSKKEAEKKVEHKKILAKAVGKAIATPLPAPTVIAHPLIAQVQAQEPNNGYCLEVPVLFYHHIQPYSSAVAKGQTALSVDTGMFDEQMSYLVSNGFTTITVKQLVDALRTHSSLPPKSIAVTLDDGYQDAYIYALPVFQKYHITANLMIATGLLGGSDYLTWDQINTLKASGLIYFTDHTWSHYAVNHGSVDKIKFEIETGRQQLEQHTGQTVDIFTYPYGSFDNEAISVLQQNGFLGAFTTLSGSYQCDSFILTLHRIRIGNGSLSSYGI